MPADSSSPSTASNGRLRQAVRTAAGLAHRLTQGVAVLAGLSGAAGGLLWALVWWPPGTSLSSLIAAALFGLLLLSPAAVLTLFYTGLRDLLALPERLSDHTRRTVEQSTETVRRVSSDHDGLLGRAWTLIKRIWGLRTLLLEHRDLLLRYGTLLRFVTPGFLVLVVGAAGISLCLIPLSALVGLLVWIL